MSTSSANGYVVCRPLGGLNDILCQIDRCSQYAIAHKRCLIVDLERNDRFQLNFSQFFSLDSFCLAEPGDLHAFEADVFPPSLSGKVEPETYKLRLSEGHLVEDSSGEVPIIPKLSTRLPHKVLVHHQWGGGVGSARTLISLGVSEWLQGRIEARLKELGPNGNNAIHFRNSDYTSSRIRLLRSIAKSKKPSLVFTDDGSLREDKLPSNCRLAYLPGSSSNAESIALAIADLIGMAKSDRIILVKLENAPVRYSGFGQLASIAWVAYSHSIAQFVFRLLYISRFFLDLRPKSWVFYALRVSARSLELYTATRKGLGLLSLF